MDDPRPRVEEDMDMDAELKLQMDMNLDMDMIPSPPESPLLRASGAPNLVLRMPSLALEMLSLVTVGIPL